MGRTVIGLRPESPSRSSTAVSLTDSHTSRPGLEAELAGRAPGVTSAIRSRRRRRPAAGSRRRAATRCAPVPCQRFAGRALAAGRATTRDRAGAEARGTRSPSRITLSPTSRATCSVRGRAATSPGRADLGHPRRRRAPAPGGEGQRVDRVVGDQQRDPVVRRQVAGRARSAAPAATPTSRPANGSSSSSRPGSVASARAIATRWACPPESSPGRRSARSPIAEPVQPVAGGRPAPRRAARRGSAARRRRCRGRTGAGTAAGPGRPRPTPRGPGRAARSRSRPPSRTRPSAGTRPASALTQRASCRRRWARSPRPPRRARR